MARPTIAFLTDFGTRDHYVGAMKGAALTVCPDAMLVDITHDVPPQDVLSGALALAAACPYFPPGTVFAAVVDPGVGTQRRAVAAEARGFRFVAPDNGLLTAVLRDLGPAAAVELAEARYARDTISRTFEGRDRFAPAAAWIASGVALAELGPAVADLVQLTIPAASLSPQGLRGEVLLVDHFGNLITNIDRAAFDGFAAGIPVDVTVGPHRVGPAIDTYASGVTGRPCALFGSSGRLEIAVPGGNAARHLGLARGAIVFVTHTGRSSHGR